MTPARLIPLPAPLPTARDGRGAGEPTRPCDASSPRTGGHPAMTLDEARAAIKRPIRADELRAACAVLLGGDWLDRERALLILALLADPATAPDPEPAPAWEVVRRLDWRDMAGAAALFLLLFAGLWLAWGLGLATGGAELMGPVQ